MSRRTICLDIGFMPREWAASQMIDGGVVRLAKRLVPHINVNVTWFSDPRYPRGMKTLAQCNYESSNESRLLRLVTKWGWKIVDLRAKPGQCGREETDNNNTGKTHEYEDTNEIITGKWGINQK